MQISMDDIIKEAQEEARKRAYYSHDSYTDKDSVSLNTVDELIESTAHRVAEAVRAGAYNQGINDMIMHIEEQISHEILSSNNNRDRIEDYDLLIEFGRGIRKSLSTTQEK